MKLHRVGSMAAQYEISPLTFYAWHSRRRFPNLFVKIGKVLFIDETELRRIARESKRLECKTGASNEH
jgi:hypothetical protein